MNMYDGILQGTPEWRAIRVGKVTGSRIADATRKLKTGKPSATRATYMGELLAERMTKLPYPTFKSAAMENGTECEPFARAAYEFETGFDIVQIAFVDHPTIPDAGCSPDGLVDLRGIVQIKCPNTSTHCATMLGEPIDGEYMKQVQWELACTSRLWCDFVSFDPRLPGPYQLEIRRVERDDKMIAELEKEVKAFQIELAAMIDALKSKRELKKQLEASANADFIAADLAFDTAREDRVFGR